MNLFSMNRSASAELARGEKMARYLSGIGEQAASEVERKAPRIVKQGSARIYSEMKTGADGVEARVIVKSSFWHFPEYGHSRYPARPYLRPGVQSVLSRVGGGWRTT